MENFKDLTGNAYTAPSIKGLCICIKKETNQEVIHHRNELLVYDLNKGLRDLYKLSISPSGDFILS